MASSSTSTLCFLILPAEVRNCIYDILFHQPFRVVLGEKKWLKNRDSTPQSSQLLETCRQVHDEATSIIYRNITIKVTDGYSMLDSREVMDFKFLRSVEIVSIQDPCSRPLDMWYLQNFTMLSSCHVSVVITGECLLNHTAERLILGQIVPAVQRSRAMKSLTGIRWRFCIGGQYAKAYGMQEQQECVCTHPVIASSLMLTFPGHLRTRLQKGYPEQRR